MDPQPKRASTAFEYFLYVAILAETGLAALIYKVIFRDPELLRLRVYFAVFYFAFLGWAIAQLHMLHRERNARGENLTANAPVIESAEIGVEAADARPAFGLTRLQLAIVVLVFATAVATFSWALRLLR
jgi:hypothetical protein